MVAAIKQIVTVGADGRIEIPRSELAPGTRVEVDVRVSTESEPAVPNLTQLEAFRALQKAMNLDQPRADKWMAENRELRNWNRPRQ